MATRQATIGDALIFMTKAAVAGLILVLGAWCFVIWRQDDVSSLKTYVARLEEGLRRAAAAHAAAEAQFELLLRAAAPCFTAEPCQPTDRIWNVPPPEGLIVPTPAADKVTMPPGFERVTP